MRIRAAAWLSPTPSTHKRPGHDPKRAPLRNRTVDLLLTIYPRADAVAICDDAAQVRGGARCCRPTYLVITRCCRPTYLVITRGPGGPDAAPPGRRPGRSLPDLRSRRPAAAARAGAAMADRQGTTLQAPAAARARHRPGKAAAGALRRLAYQPTVSLAGQRSLHGRRRGNQPNALPHPPAPHPPARPSPAGHQTRPRHPARPARGRPALPMSALPARLDAPACAR